MRRETMLRRLAAHPALAVVTVAVSLLPAGCSGIGAWSSPAPVIVGVDLNLTGRGPGVVFDNGLRLALEQVNEQLAGQRRLQLRVLDNRGDEDISAQNLTRLSADPHVAAIITAGCAACVIEAADTLTVPVISLDGSEAVAAPAAERRWIFRLGPNAGDNADVLSLAMARAGIETIGVIAVKDAYGEEGLRWVRDAAGRDRLDVVAAPRVRAGDEASVTAAARAIAQWQPPPDPFTPTTEDRDGGGPDAVVLWTYAPQAAEVAAALRDAGYTGRLFLDMVAADQLFLSGVAAAFDGATLVFTATPVADQRIASSPALAARQAWLLAYVSRYDTYDLHSTWAADALLVLADAIKRTDTIERAAVRDRLESTRLDGMTGPIRLTGDQHSALSPHALVTLTATGDRWQ